MEQNGTEWNTFGTNLSIPCYKMSNRTAKRREETGYRFNRSLVNCRGPLDGERSPLQLIRQLRPGQLPFATLDELSIAIENFQRSAALMDAPCMLAAVKALNSNNRPPVLRPDSRRGDRMNRTGIHNEQCPHFEFRSTSLMRLWR
jgi:hypothetical protein